MITVGCIRTCRGLGSNLKPESSSHSVTGMYAADLPASCCVQDAWVSQRQRAWSALLACLPLIFDIAAGMNCSGLTGRLTRVLKNTIAILYQVCAMRLVNGSSVCATVTRSLVSRYRLHCFRLAGMGYSGLRLGAHGKLSDARTAVTAGTHEEKGRFRSETSKMNILCLNRMTATYFI